MDLILPAGTVLFHGTCEDFPAEEIRGGGYDQVIWTADSSTIAQSYIPLSGISGITGPEEISRPSKDPIIQQLQKQICIEYDYSDIKWDYKNMAIRFKLPQGWDDLPTYEEVTQLMLNAGWEKSVYGTFRLRYTYEDGPDGKSIPRLFAPGEKLIGRLFIFTALEPLKIYDNTRGGETESDLLNLEYHKIDLFRDAEEAEYDGIKINDFAQSKYWGNLGHTSIGLFEQAREKLSWVAIPAVNFEWDENTPQNTTITPEYQAYLDTQKRRNPVEEPNAVAIRILLAIWYIRNEKKYAYWSDIEDTLADHIPIDDLRRSIRWLQDRGFIDSRPEGYWLYPNGFWVVSEILRKKPKQYRRNADDKLRSLERAVAGGDTTKQEALKTERKRAGLCPGCGGSILEDYEMCLKCQPHELKFDTLEILDDHVKYLMSEENVTEDDARGYAELNQELYTDHWEWIEEQLTEDMESINSDHRPWCIKGEGMGWQRRSGEKVIRADGGRHLLRAILPTGDVTFTIWFDGEHFWMTASHHDAPTGESYIITLAYTCENCEEDYCTEEEAKECCSDEDEERGFSRS